MTSLEYHPYDEPFEVGRYHGDPIMYFGAYRMRLDNGFCYLSSHTGFRRTVSEAPIPIDELGFFELMEQQATRALQQQLELPLEERGRE